MILYTIKGSLGPHNEVQALINRIESEPFAEEVEISAEALEFLGDIVNQGLEYNEEDPVIPPRHVDEIVDLLNFLGL